MVSRSNVDAGSTPQLPPTPEALRAAADTRAAAFGRILALLMASPRHSKMSLGEANVYVTPAVASGQIALIGAQQTEGGPMALAAAAWWAFVSADVDQRLTASREPFLKLEANEWQCGEQPWIIDAIGEPRLVNDLVKKLAERNFRGKPVKLRAILPDGRIAVGKLEPKEAVAEPAKS